MLGGTGGVSGGGCRPIGCCCFSDIYVECSASSQNSPGSSWGPGTFWFSSNQQRHTAGPPWLSSNGFCPQGFSTTRSLLPRGGCVNSIRVIYQEGWLPLSVAMKTLALIISLPRWPLLLVQSIPSGSEWGRDRYFSSSPAIPQVFSPLFFFTFACLLLSLSLSLSLSLFLSLWVWTFSKGLLKLAMKSFYLKDPFPDIYLRHHLPALTILDVLHQEIVIINEGL